MASTTPPTLLPPAQLVEPTLNHERHKMYWLRCLRTFLPNAYTSGDSNRMSLAFFTISALDLLGCLHSITTPEEREGYVTWLYICQHPNGGFRGSPAMDLGESRTLENAVWDAPTVPATFFALSALCILGDDLSRVKRKECLVWLNKMQRPDGSFGETIGDNGRIEGGTDARFGYCATGVRWMLRGNVEGEVEGIPDIQLDSFVNCIRLSQTYDGAISEAPFHESHAGFTYCAISALWFVSRLPNEESLSDRTPSGSSTGLTNLHLTVSWLVSRQTILLDEEESVDSEADDENSKIAEEPDDSSTTQSDLEYQWVGFNGRCNKVADTCYEWWALGSLAVLGRAHLCNQPSNRRYLLDKTQHIIGGFGKGPGDPPDLYHSYLGLAALSILKEKPLKPIHPALCFSEDAKNHLESLPWRKSFV